MFSNRMYLKVLYFKTQDTPDLVDGDSVHWQCTITPANDPELSIEWTFNGNPLPLSSRLKTISDFGFVTLDICGVDSRDSGEYICKATNRYITLVV